MYRYFFIASTVDGEWIYQCSWVESIKGIKYEKKASLDRTQKEIEENLSKLKYKLEVIIRSSMFFFV